MVGIIRSRCQDPETRISDNPRKQSSREGSLRKRGGKDGASNVGRHKNIKYFLNCGRVAVRTLVHDLRIWHIG